MMRTSTYGIDKNEVKKIINHKISQNPDIYYFINNDYVEELINLIIDGVAEAIEENNKKIFNGINTKY